MEPITSFLSPDSTEKRKAATIDAALSSLRAAGAVGAVDEFYPKIVEAIRKGDLDEFDALGDRLLDFASKNMSIPADAKTQENEVARSIEQLVSVADSRNIAIPSAILNDAANAFVSNDQRAVVALANNINSLLEKNIEAQITEKKVPTRLEDGSVVLIGETTRTRYDQTNTPIPSSNKNAQLFSLFASESYSPRSKEIMAAMGGESDLVGASAIGAPMQKQPDIGANPEAYASMEKLPEPTLDPIERNTQANERARLKYEAGDRIGALNTLRALKAEDIYGDITDETLDSYFGKSSATIPKKDTRIPIGEIIPNKK